MKPRTKIVLNIKAIATEGSNFSSILSVIEKVRAKPTIGPPTIKLPDGWI